MVYRTKSEFFSPAVEVLQYKTLGQAASQKIKNRIPMWSSNSTSKYMPQRIVYNSTNHNFQKVEANQMSPDRWMDKEDVAHIYNGILLSHKKKWNWVICSEVDGPKDCHTEWSKSKREKQIPYASTHIWNLKQTNKQKGSEEPRGRTGIKTQT